MTASWLSYALVEDGATGTVRPRYLDRPGRPASEELLRQVEPLLAYVHPWTGTAESDSARCSGPAPELHATHGDLCGCGRAQQAGALSHSRLPDGSGLLCHAGVDGQPAALGEWPPRYLLAVHVPYGPGAFGSFWPIDAWRSPSWERPADARAAAREREAGLLPEPGAQFDAELLVRFAREHAGRVAPFLADVRRLFASPAGRQIVIAEADPETVARWIALACASLPAAHARALTFSTRTARPDRAPQQILGIGPDADFDRSDPLALRHLYRVHDGLEGPGSPYVADAWAELTAELWLAGIPPLSLANPAGVLPEPFALGPLVVPALLRKEAGTGGAAGPAVGAWRTGARLYERMRDLDGDVHRSVLAELARLTAIGDPAAWTVAGAPDPPTLDQLTELCAEFSRTGVTGMTDPLALAVARQRIDAVLTARGAVPGPQTVLGLPPLSEAARSALHREYGPRLADWLRRRTAEPLANWAGALEFSLALGSLPNRATEHLADRFARMLLTPVGPDRAEQAEAAALLNRLADPELIRQVLAYLGTSASHALPELTELVGSAQGAWLREHIIAEAPLPLRLVDAAVRLRREPAGLHGTAAYPCPAPADHYTELVGITPAGVPADADTLSLIWRLVWPDSDPTAAEALLLVRDCHPDLFARAGLNTRLGSALTRGDPVDDDLVALAGKLIRDGRYRLTDQQRAFAELLVKGRDSAGGAAPVPVALTRVTELSHRARPLPGELREWSIRILAERLARASLPELCHTSTVRALLASGDPALLGAYRDALLSDRHREERIRGLSHNARYAADAFRAWRNQWDGSTAAWKAICDECLSAILDPALRRMSEAQNRQVAARVHEWGGRWGQSWDVWQRKHRATDDRFPPAPSSGKPPPPPPYPRQHN